MSNKNVPGFFHAVVDEVAKNIENDFREYGVSQDVLSDLKNLWMDKIVASHVADFQAETVSVAQQPAHPAFATHSMAHPQMMLNPAYAAVTAAYANAAAAGVKSEPNDPRYMLNGAAPAGYTIPALPGPSLGQRVGQPATSANIMAYQASRYTAAAANPQSSSTSSSSPSLPQMPQVDGPSSYESEDDDDEPGPSQPQYAPRTSHPSIPQPQQQQQKKANADDEAINSDLDDSEDDEGAGDEGPTASDIMFCTYDKVARVKNKWKCVLKDGIVHVNGKDYLFQKCTGEFEW